MNVMICSVMWFTSKIKIFMTLTKSHIYNKYNVLRISRNVLFRPLKYFCIFESVGGIGIIEMWFFMLRVLSVRDPLLRRRCRDVPTLKCDRFIQQHSTIGRLLHTQLRLRSR